MSLIPTGSEKGASDSEGFANDRWQTDPEETAQEEAVQNQLLDPGWRSMAFIDHRRSLFEGGRG